jgi:hypothetical protein
MPDIIRRDLIRAALNVRSTDQWQDAVTGSTPDMWAGTDLSIQLGLFSDKAKTALVDGAAYSSITCEVKPLADKTGAALMAKTVAGPFTNPTQETWLAGTAQHVEITFTFEESELDLGTNDSKQFWVVISAITNDTPARNITLGCTTLTVKQDGHVVGGTAPEPGDPLYFTADECDARFLRLTGFQTSFVRAAWQIWNEDDQFWHFDSDTGGDDGQCGNETVGTQNGGFDGSTNPGLISRIGAVETLANKTLTSPTINSPTINSPTFGGTAGTLTGWTLAACTLTDPAISGLSFDDPAITGDVTGAATYHDVILHGKRGGTVVVSVTVDNGGFDAPAATLLVEHPGAGGGPGRTYNFGLYRDDTYAYSVDNDTVAKKGDLATWSPVTSVHGRTGAVVAASGDYDTDDVTEGGNLYYTDARARAAVSGAGPVDYSSTTGIISMHVADSTHDGYLDKDDWIAFNAKQAALGYTPADIDGDTFTGEVIVESLRDTVDAAAIASGTLVIDAAGAGVITVDVDEDISTFTFSNKAAGRGVLVVLTDDGSARSLTWPAGWRWFNTGGAPAAMTASATALLALKCLGTTDSDVLATYVENV